jgi:hypothetical protein
MGASTISMAIFNSYVCLPEGIGCYIMDVIGFFAIQGLSMDIQQEEPQYGTVLQWPPEFNMTL